MSLSKLHTVQQFASKYPAFPVGALRQHIFRENQNGLKKAGAVKRIGRKVLIDEEKFFEWIEAINRKESA
ncbi:MAG: hypothetical protein Kow0065_13620 [Methylomicrobium sp.]